MTHSLRDGLLYVESLGSGDFDLDFHVYDSDSGKWYRNVFDLEMAFWASKFYRVDSLTPVESKPLKNYEPVKFCFEEYKIPIIGIDINTQFNYNVYMLNKNWLDSTT